jgi:uncharacterized membrane protein YqjE
MNIGLGQIGPALKTLLAASFHRGELASLELGEACDHLFISATLGFGAAALILLGGFAGTFTVAALVWDRPDRGLILGLLAAGYLLAGGGFGWFAARRIRSWRPLEETCRQLNRDHECLQAVLTPATANHSSHS